MPGEGNLPVEAARSILRFRLAQADYDRVNELAAKPEPALTAEERAELDEYEHITYLVELMQSKARLSLKRAGLRREHRMDVAMHQLVWQRAQHRCEYCQCPADISLLPFKLITSLLKNTAVQLQLKISL